MSKSKRTSLNGFIGQKVTVTIGGVPLEGYDASTSKQSIKDKKIDEYTALLMSSFLLEHGYSNASNEIKFFIKMTLAHSPNKIVRANTPLHNGN